MDEKRPVVQYTVVVDSWVCHVYNTVTDTFVERVTEFLKLFKRQNFSLTFLTMEERKDFWTVEKYFKNIRHKLVGRGYQVPSLDECAQSCIGILFGMVWDTKDPETVWDPSGSVIEEQPSVCSSGYFRTTSCAIIIEFLSHIG